MSAKPIMFQGTGSHVGKSIITAALCRIFRQDGYSVAPFKAQNMSNNSFVTEEGGEMGRAQVVQAQAAGVTPHVDMNPILLKPTGNSRSQVVVAGKALDTLPWGEYRKLKDQLLAAALDAYHRLAAKHDIIVIEGAGSPAEVNLKDGDIVNMRIAKETNAPVYLVTDIDRGGALAWIVGTLALLPPDEQALVRGIVINKFRGDVVFLQPGLDFLERHTGKKVVGVMPYVTHLGIDDEDSVSLEDVSRSSLPSAQVHIAVIQLPTISNFTDFAPLAEMPGVSLRYVRPGMPLAPADCVLIPGSKNTLQDLQSLWESGTTAEIIRFAQNGGTVIGICGGYQILGLEVSDPTCYESTLGRIAGLGLLPIKTRMEPEKQTYQVDGEAVLPTGDAAPLPITGYEIHAGVTERLGGRPWVTITRLGSAERREEGCYVTQGKGLIAGTYVHGIFDAAAFRQAFVNMLRLKRGLPLLTEAVENAVDPFDRLADIARKHLDMAAIYRELGLR